MTPTQLHQKPALELPWNHKAELCPAQPVNEGNRSPLPSPLTELRTGLHSPSPTHSPSFQPAPSRPTPHAGYACQATRLAARVLVVIPHARVRRAW